MTFPNFKDKYDKKSLFTAGEYTLYMHSKNNHQAEVPETMFLYYAPTLTHILSRHSSIKRVENFFKVENKNFGFVGDFGIGAPGAVAMVEEFAARGTKEFISLGVSGGLQKKSKVGDIFLIDRAIRDEGTSHHYLPSEKYISASPESLLKIKNFLDKKKISYDQGTTWTTDAVYRETIEEVHCYQSEGVLAVDMEASAIFSVAKYLRIQSAGLFLMSDSLASGKDWEPKFHIAKEKLSHLLEDIILDF